MKKKANVPLDNFDKASVEKIGEKLVDRLTLNKNNMIMTSSQPDDNLTEYVLVYNDKAKDEILFSSFVELTINKNGDVTGKSKRYKSIEFSGVNTKLIPVDEVLYKFMYNIEGKENNEVIKIIGIDIGYYVDEEVNEYLAEPCYRISLGDGEVHYINAYNNEEISYTESNQEE